MDPRSDFTNINFAMVDLGHGRSGGRLGIGLSILFKWIAIIFARFGQFIGRYKYSVIRETLEVSDSLDRSVIFAFGFIQSDASPDTSGELRCSAKVERAKFVSINENSISYLK